MAIHVPTIKKSDKAKKDEYIEKAMRPVRGQLHLFNVRGVKEKTLTYRDLKTGNFVSEVKRHGDTFEIPYYFVKYLNAHGTFKKNKKVPMRLTGKSAIVTEDERLYYFMVRDIMSPEDLIDLEGKGLPTATFD